ncbi:hypothetical protein AB0I98_25900 [Streptomyces sp. NPDC050211]|uniref:hypothetical protein n=1 Tax=Streptomyces sp. NPDC050211 TaxID=3154932 RepID=UPI00344521D3
MDGKDDEQTNYLDELCRFTVLCLQLGISWDKAAGDFRDGLEELRQQGKITLDEMAVARAKTQGKVREDPTEWTEGFVAGYLSAWCAATLRILETRDVPVGKEIWRGLYACPDADALTHFLDRSVTVTHAEDLFAAEA